MLAVIMAGGLGTRLQPFTQYKPKPMMPVLNKPIMEHILCLLKKNGFDRAIAALCFKPQEIKNYFGNGNDWDMELKYSLENKPLGTAGAVALACRQHSVNEPFLVISGDCLTDFNLAEAFAFHQKQGADVTIVLKRIKNPREYGIVITDKGGAVQKFLEKPERGEVFSDTVNTGIYIVNPDVAAAVSQNRSVDFSKNLFPAMLKQGKKVMGKVMRGYWADIGNLKQYVQAQFDFLEGKVKCDVPGNQVAPGVWTGDNVQIKNDQNLIPPVFLGNHCRVEDNVAIGPRVVLSDNTVVDKNTVIRKSVVMAASFIGENVEINSAIIGNNVLIESGCAIQEDAVVADECSIGKSVIIHPEVMIWPSKKVENETVVTDHIVWQDEFETPGMFARDGIIGLANLRITPDFAARVGMAWGAKTGIGASVVLSRDTSSLSRLIKRSLASGLMAVGVNVIDLEVSPAPIVRFAIKSLQMNGGIYICISKEHSEVVKIQFFNENGINLGTDDKRKIESIFHRAAFPRLKSMDVGDIHAQTGFADTYHAKVMEHFENIRPGEKKHMRAVVDFAYGKASMILPPILNELLCDVISLRSFSTVRPRFAYSPEDAVKHISNLTRHNAEFGVMLDVNGEDIVLFDENGKQVPDGITRYLLIQHYLQSRNSDRVIVSSNWPLAYIRRIQAAGKTVVPSQTDPAKMMKLAEADSQANWMNFEHFYLGFDGIFSICKLVEFLRHAGRPLSEIIRDAGAFRVLKKKIKCPWQKTGQVLRTISDKYKSEQTSLFDGVKVNGEKGWFLILPEADEPMLSIFAEARDLTTAQQYIHEAETVITEALKEN
jgi:mannose-1-phosphate guanylyltransferase/phosphomannomutase